MGGGGRNLAVAEVIAEGANKTHGKNGKSN